MNIFGFFLFLRFHTYYKSADDIKNIHNLMALGQVTLLMFSSILLWTMLSDGLTFEFEEFWDIFHAFSYTVQFSHKNAIISSGGRMWFPPLNVSCYAIAMRVLMLCYTALKSMLS